MCNYADKTADDNSPASDDLENDFVKDDKPSQKNVEEDSDWEGRL